MSGLRHGYGVRQSAPFSVATPVRYEFPPVPPAPPPPPGGVARQRKLRHRNSMPALVGPASAYGDGSPPPTPAPRPGATLPQRGRSGFVLTGGGGGGDGRPGRPTPPRRAASAHRPINDSLASISLYRRKSDARPDDTASQVCLALILVSPAQ